jgi:hypothetical protein
MIGSRSGGVADVEDHHVVALDRIVDAVWIAGWRQDTDVSIAGDDANKRAGAKTIDTDEEMSPYAFGCGRRAVRRDVAADVTKVLEGPGPPT